MQDHPTHSRTFPEKSLKCSTLQSQLVQFLAESLSFSYHVTGRVWHFLLEKKIKGGRMEIIAASTYSDVTWL
ncbi:hypothetical protein V8E51_004963, partial [Hyaloscypha variabilis]